ncbi:MAG: thioredoxin family protein [Bacteroidales bacterium]|jgi:thioredoxin-related protein
MYKAENHYMKNIMILLGFILLIAGNINSQNNKPFINESFAKAISQAKQENKYLLLDFYTVWCGSCKAYDKFVFSKSEIQIFIQKKFIALSIDAEKGEGKELGKKFEVLSYPQIIVAQPDGKEIDRITGFDSKYSENPKVFIKKINNILDGTSTLLSLETDVNSNPTNIPLTEKLIHEYIQRDQYSKITPYARELMQVKDSSIKNKGEFYYCYALIEDKEVGNPSPMIDLLKRKTTLSNEYIGAGFASLLKYYNRKNDIQNIDYYFQKVIAADSSNWYNKKKYALFLFENKLNLDKAQNIAKEYYNAKDIVDHYQPLLMAYSYSYQNNIEEGMKLFDEYMDKTSAWSMDDKQWAYFYYADFANGHNVRLAKALEYAKGVSDYRGQDVACNILLAELLVKNNQIQTAIDVLKKSLEYVQAKTHYSEINELIKQYESKK